MIPIGDSVRSRTFPYVNVAIIASCVAVFLYQLTLSAVPDKAFTAAPGLGVFSDLDLFVFEWGSVPVCLRDSLGFDVDTQVRSVAAVCGHQERELLTPFTAMFIHGGWVHLVGNMVFLWVFGDNVEDALGHVRYAVFYVLGGLVATAAHVLINQDDVIPAIGASGAIAAVLGAYLVLYPRATVAAILPIFILFWMPFYIPAVILIGFWFLLQLFNGAAALATRDVVGAGGVAWFAHIGGFLAGLLVVKLFMLGRRTPPTPERAWRRRSRW